MARPEKKSGQKYWSGRGGGSPGGAPKSPSEKVRAEGTGAGRARAPGQDPGRSGKPESREKKNRVLPGARTPECQAVLENGLSMLGLEPVLASGIDTYLKEIELWNPRLGLVEAGGRDLIVKHVLDSLSLCPPIAAWLTRRKVEGNVPAEGQGVFRIADLGSGGGFPALPLALFLKAACPGAWSMDLFDRQARRTVFLQNCIALLGLKGLVEVHQTLLEGMDQQTGAVASPSPTEDLLRVAKPRQGFDLVTARAFRPLDDLVLSAMQDMLSSGGWICLMKARTDSIKEELTRVRYSMTRINKMEDLPPTVPSGSRNAWVLPLVVPGLDEERHLVFLPGK